MLVVDQAGFIVAADILNPGPASDITVMKESPLWNSRRFRKKLDEYGIIILGDAIYDVEELNDYLMTPYGGQSRLTATQVSNG